MEWMKRRRRTIICIVRIDAHYSFPMLLFVTVYFTYISMVNILESNFSNIHRYVYNRLKFCADALTKIDNISTYSFCSQTFYFFYFISIEWLRIGLSFACRSSFNAFVISTFKKRKTSLRIGYFYSSSLSSFGKCT